MKKVIFTVLLATILSACGGMKVYNSQLKQIELHMTKQEVVALMGEKYNTTGIEMYGDDRVETIEYKDMYKNHWFFTFVNNSLDKWWKETEQ